MPKGLEAQAGVTEGEVLAGKYRVEKVLGVGGMGVVVAARHIELDEKVAIKFLLPSMLDDGAAVASAGVREEPEQAPQRKGLPVRTPKGKRPTSREAARPEPPAPTPTPAGPNTARVNLEKSRIARIAMEGSHDARPDGEAQSSPSIGLGAVLARARPLEGVRM